MHLRLNWPLAALLALTVLPGVAFARPEDGMKGVQDQRAEEREIGVFATHCFYDHRGSDDPIVHPGHAGMSHSHDFFGNTTTNASSTLESLRLGRTTCLADQDLSGYWVPTLSKNGQAVRPNAVHVYYRVNESNASEVKPFPAGFKIVAGDARATAPQSLKTVGWSCRGEENAQSETPPACPEGAPLKLHIRFPECWDGANLDSADHKSHMAYGNRGGCPSSHPVPLPKLAMNVIYPLTGENGSLTLASGSIHSAHGDFFNAWDPGFLSQKVQDCLNELDRCGTLGNRGPRRPGQNDRT